MVFDGLWTRNSISALGNSHMRSLVAKIGSKRPIGSLSASGALLAPW